MPQRERVLAFLSYNGSRFHGLTRSPERSELASVESCLLAAISRALRVSEESIGFFASSRTDAGVHSTSNPCLLDLPSTSAEPPRDLSTLAGRINEVLNWAQLPLRVNSLRHVSHGFNPRKEAQSRSYLYRFGIIKDESGRGRIHEPWCWHCPPGPRPLDIQRWRQGAELFLGSKTLVSFLELNEDSLRSSGVKTTFHSSIQQVAASEDFDLFHANISAAAFGFRQIRKTVAALVALSTGRMEIAQFRRLFTDPHPEALDSLRVGLAPPHGLILTGVHYDPEAFENPRPFSDPFISRSVADLRKAGISEEAKRSIYLRHLVTKSRPPFW